VMRNPWITWKKPHIILATEVAKSFTGMRLTKYRIQRPFQRTKCVRTWALPVPFRVCARPCSLAGEEGGQ